MRAAKYSTVRLLVRPKVILIVHPVTYHIIEFDKAFSFDTTVGITGQDTFIATACYSVCYLQCV